MDPQGTYIVRWKGKETGPHSLGEIRELLDIGEFGLMHEAFVNNQWITLRRLIEIANQTPKQEPAPRTSPAPSITPTAPPAHIVTAVPSPQEQKQAKEEEEEVDSEEDDSMPAIPLDVVMSSLGYLLCLTALFVYPQYVGFAALMVGAINAAFQRYLHGALQMVLALLCWQVGLHFTALIGRP